MIHYIQFKATAHATEDLSGVLKALDFFLYPCLRIPDENEILKLHNIVSANGHFGNPISLISAKIENKGNSSRFVNFFNENISDEDRQILRSEMPDRLDDDLNFYMRFDKQEAFAGRLKLTDGDDAVFVKIKIETYPKSWENAGLIVEELFG
ncbi:MAG: exosome subunit [Methanosarcinaceae archaeon]|nr:exosome subunit [Methanosarcinaceae archaeon]